MANMEYYHESAYEKKKFYVTRSTGVTLDDDARYFEIYNKQFTKINRNKFLTRLICNYSYAYKDQNDQRNEDISSIFDGILSKKDKNRMTKAVIDYFDKNELSKRDGKKEVIISYQPTAATIGIFSTLEDEKSNDKTFKISRFLRGVFESYCQKSRADREKIIFKEEYDLIQEAINNRKKIKLKIRDETGKITDAIVSPYQIVTNREESSNYLICVLDGEPRSYRLCRVKPLKGLLKQPSEIDKDLIPLLNKTVKLSPQFAFKKDEKIVVRFTDYGLYLFRRVVVNRPNSYTVDENDPHLYTFDCTSQQARIYFTRLGKDAMIIAPDELKQEVIRYYKEALEAQQLNEG